MKICNQTHLQWTRINYFVSASKKQETREEKVKKKKAKFAARLEPFLNVYSRDTLNDFYFYWTQCNDNGIKLHWEKERTFDLAARLRTWKKNQQRFGGTKQSINWKMV